MSINELDIPFTNGNIILWSNVFPSFYHSNGNMYDVTNNTFEIEPTGISRSVKKIFYLIDFLGNSIVCNTSKIFSNPIDPSTGMTIPLSKNELKRRNNAGLPLAEKAQAICCAYSALVMTYAFIEATKMCSSSLTLGLEKFVDCVRRFLTKLKRSKPQDGILLEIETLHTSINAYNYFKQNLYGDVSEISRLNNCPGGIELKRNGIHLFSLVSQFYTNGGCGTGHHFMVYVIDDFCIIYDTWMGGSQGNRCNWTRLISTDQFIYLINLMNDTQTEKNIKEEIILTIFAGPNKNGQGYNDDYYFRYYSEYEMMFLIEKNKIIVDKYRRDPSFSHDKQFQQLVQKQEFYNVTAQMKQYVEEKEKYLERELNQERVQQETQELTQDREALEQKLQQERAAEVPVDSEIDVDLFDQMAEMPLEEQELNTENQPKKKFKDHPPGLSLINPSVIDSNPSSQASSPFHFSPINFTPPGGGSQKLKRNKRKTKCINKRKSKRKHRNRRKNKTNRRNINNK